MAVRKKYGKSVGVTKTSRANRAAPPASGPNPVPLPHPKTVRFQTPGDTTQSKQRPAGSKVKVKKKTVSPLARGPRTLLKDQRRFQSLLVSVTQDATKQTRLARSIRSTIREFDRLRAIRVRTITTGRGAPSKKEIDFLVSFLLTAFYDYSGIKGITRHYKKDKGSRADLFLREIFEDLGIPNSDSWIKKHTSEKATLKASASTKTFT